MSEPTTASFDWQAAIKRKSQENRVKTPKEWLLDPAFADSLQCGPTKSANLIELKAAKRSGLLTPKEVEITEAYNAVALLEKLRSGVFSAFEVTTAFCKRAAIAQQLLCCLTEVFYAEALERAKRLDEYLRKEGKVSGPLHGLPISIKVSKSYMMIVKAAITKMHRTHSASGVISLPSAIAHFFPILLHNMTHLWSICCNLWEQCSTLKPTFPKP